MGWVEKLLVVVAILAALVGVTGWVASWLPEVVRVAMISAAATTIVLAIIFYGLLSIYRLLTADSV